MDVSRRIFAVGTLLAAGALLVAGTSPAIAQQPENVSAGPVSVTALASQGAAAAVAARPGYLMASADDSFVQRSVISSGNVQYVPYERTYRGLPVVGGDFVLVTNNSGQVVYHSVAQERAIGNVSVQSKLTQVQAEAVASKQLSKLTKVESSRQVVYALGAGAAKIAWETTVQGTGPEGYSRLTVVVDAQSGRVLETLERVMRGTGTGAWNGPNPLTLRTATSGSNFLLSDPNTTNMPCQDAANNTTFTKTTDTWGNGVKTSKETGCVDSLYAAEKQRDMLSAWLGRNGMNGNGGAWPIRVGLNDVNAYYDGSQIQIGHRQGNNEWISSIDVVAHEMGHGIDDTTPGGISRAGTQEFIGDAFGAAVEAYVNEPAPYDTPDYTVGEMINLVGNGPIRNMYNPSLVNNDPNCYSSSIPSTEVHKAAGPGNHWFTLLSIGSGGSPNSPTCNSSTVTGLGIQNAMKILYNAMLMKTSSSSYLKYRTWTLQAAKNLFPSGCVEFNKVKAAWDAVSVPAQTADPTCTGGPTQLSLTNPGNQTGSVGAAASLTLAAAGGTTPYTFSATGLPAGLSINASTGVISGTPTTAATYNVTATVTDSASPAASASQSFTWTISPTGTCNSPATNGTDVSVPDNTTVYSNITIAGCTGNASATTKVEVHIVHTYRGDLVVSLIAPDGTAYVMLNRSGGSTDNVDQTFTVNASSEVKNGTWRLRVQDAASIDTGYINSWTLTL